MTQLGLFSPQPPNEVRICACGKERVWEYFAGAWWHICPDCWVENSKRSQTVTAKPTEGMKGETINVE